MAASANWRAILEAIKLIGLAENVEKLKNHEKQRNSVILMLTSANSRFRATSADWVVEKELSAVLDAVIAAKKAKDIELEKLLREFLKVTVFPPSMFRSYKGKEDDREDQPEEKKVKLEPPKLWSKLREIGDRPEHARVLMESLTTYGRSLMTGPYLKILVSCSFASEIVPDPSRLTTAHCQLLGTFVSVVDRFRFHVKGNRQSYIGRFIKNSLHALIVNEEVDLIELEDLVNLVADMDSAILQPLNPILWTRWRKGDLISVMTRVCAFYNKTQSSKRLFGMVFSVNFEDDCDNLSALFEQPFKALTRQWLPSALIADLEYLTRTALNIFKSPENERKIYNILNIIITVICYELECLDINGLTIAEQDERDLTCILANILSILEQYHIRSGSFWVELAAKYWKVEKARRMFLCEHEYEVKFLSENCCEKLKSIEEHLLPKAGVQAMAELLILRLEWAVIHELNVKKHTKRLQLFFETNKTQMSPYSQEILLRLVPEVFEFCPKNATQLVIRLMEMDFALLVTEIFAASLPILERVSTAIIDSENEKLARMLPLTFLSTNKKLELFKERLSFTSEGLQTAYKVLTHSNSIGERKALKAFELGDEFFNAMRSEEVASQNNYLILDELANMSAECAFHSAEASDILSAIDENFDDERIVHSLIKELRKRLYKGDTGNVELWPLIKKIFELNLTSRFTTYSDALDLLIYLFSSGREKAKFSAEQLKKLELLTKLVTTKMEFCQTQEELGDLSNMLKRIFDILDRCGENNALDLLRKEKHPVVIGVVWKYLKRNQITIRLRMMPADRRTLELQHVVAAISRQEGSEFTITEKSADDQKMQVLQKWIHGTIDHLIDTTATMGNYVFMAMIMQQIFTLKINISRVRLQRILDIAMDLPEELTDSHLYSFIGILDTMLTMEKLRKKLCQLAPLIVAAVKMYIVAILELKNAADLVEPLRRLLQSISNNSHLSEKIGKPMGFILEPFLSLAIKFPEVNNTVECLKLLYKIGSEVQVKSHFAALPVAFRKKASETYKMWQNECGKNKANVQFMSV